MKIMAFNGSPRKAWNTCALLEEALRGAQDQGADIELVNIFDLRYRGCTSCFACKRKGVLLDCCAQHDELRPFLEQIHECDGFILGSPIYFGNVTGAMRNLMERILFPYISYDNQPSHFGKKIKVGLVYTMNVPENNLEEVGYTQLFNSYEGLFKRIFGQAESLIVTETWQFDDYSKYAAGMFNAEERAKRHNTVFKEDCAKAYQMGKRWAASFSECKR